MPCAMSFTLGITEAPFGDFGETEKVPPQLSLACLARAGHTQQAHRPHQPAQSLSRPCRLQGEPLPVPRCQASTKDMLAFSPHHLGLPSPAVWVREGGSD